MVSVQPLPLMPGERFGSFVVVGPGEPYVDKRGRSQRRWLVRCDCGNERNVWASSLRSGKSTSCGCTRIIGVRAAAPLRRQEVVTYFGMHRRLGRDRGKASTYTCVDCGKQASAWSYDGNDPDELYYDPPRKRRLAYSLDQTRYAPRCTSCHILLDEMSTPVEVRASRRG